MVVKEDADTVGFVLWQHLLGAPCFRAGFCSKTIIPDSEEHPLASSRIPKAVLRWIILETPSSHLIAWIALGFAIYGTLVATCVGAWTIIGIRRDRVALKIQVRFGYVATNGVNAWMRSSPNFDPSRADKTTLLVIEAINTGRRSITLNAGGLAYKDKPLGMFTGEGAGKTFPMTLDEGRSDSTVIPLFPTVNPTRPICRTLQPVRVFEANQVTFTQQSCQITSSEFCWPNRYRRRRFHSTEGVAAGLPPNMPLRRNASGVERF